MKINVLDNGYVQFIDAMGSDESVIEAARMSTGRGFEGWEKDAGLLEFLYRNQHTSPFEMCELVVEVQAPLFVFREWHRHRTMSYNEFSARYAQMPNLHYVPELTRIQKQGTINKQGSGEGLPEEYARHVIEEFKEQQEDIYQSYDALVEGGVSKEVARINAPVSRYSKMRAKANLLNWFRFLDLRLRPNAQYEIRVFAEAVAELIKNQFPRCYKLFEEYSLYGTKFSRTEMEAIRQLVDLDKTGHVKSLFQNEKRYEEFLNKLKLGGAVL